jgi:hypothetical protein
MEATGDGRAGQHHAGGAAAGASPRRRARESRHDVRMLQVGGGTDREQESIGAEFGADLRAHHPGHNLAIVPEVVREIDRCHRGDGGVLRTTTRNRAPSAVTSQLRSGVAVPNAPVNSSRGVVCENSGPAPTSTDITRIMPCTGSPSISLT